MMQGQNEEEKDILLGGRCTEGRKRAQHTIMIKENHKTVLQDSHQQGKMEQDSKDASSFQSRVVKAGYQEHVFAVKLTQERAKLFLMPSWCQELPGFACLQTLYSCEDSSTFACTHLRNQPHMGMVYCNSLRKKLFKWMIDKHLKFKLSVDTLQSSFQLFDRCTQAQPSIHSGQIYLLCGVCLWIASKFCEPKHLSMADMLHTFGTITDKKGLFVMERHVLNITGGHIHAPTPFAFTQGLILLLKPSPVVEAMSFYLCDLFILETDAIGIKPSSVAGACLIVAIHRLKPPVWLKHAISLADIAIVTRTPISELHSLVGKVQSLNLPDISVT